MTVNWLIIAINPKNENSLRADNPDIKGILS